eukprot:SAG31_NODE_435_length_15733_cov_6.508251_7_plen_53_part_00
MRRMCARVNAKIDHVAGIWPEIRNIAVRSTVMHKLQRLAAGTSHPEPQRVLM